MVQLQSGADGVIQAAKGTGGGTANTVRFVVAVGTHFLLLTAFGSLGCSTIFIMHGKLYLSI